MSTNDTPQAHAQNSDRAPADSRIGSELYRFEKDLTGQFNGHSIEYHAIAGDTVLLDEQGRETAAIFSIAYLMRGDIDVKERPVCFLFNGGPISSSLWLHMGALGPRTVGVPSDARHAGSPPYELGDNPDCLLDVSDLVFIDPVGVGYSRVREQSKNADFWGLMEDARAFADFIAKWITDNGRWNSPKFIVGESYGTVRASVVAQLLTDKYVSINGMALVSAVLDYQNSRPRPGDGGILSYASYIPSFAAAAHYHGMAGAEASSLEAFLEEARLFARTEYALGLIANQRLDPSERRSLVAKLARFSGLTEDYIDRSNLRIPVDRFFRELLRARSLTIGRLDARYVMQEPDHAGEVGEADPTFDAIGGAFVAAVNDHLHELGVRMPVPYHPMRVVEGWNWQFGKQPPSGGGYVNVVPHLGRAMRHNTQLRIMMATGYYDLATPFFGMENAMTQFGIDQSRVIYNYYESGHMIFVHDQSRSKFTSDLRELIVGNQTN